MKAYELLKDEKNFCRNSYSQNSGIPPTFVNPRIIHTNEGDVLLAVKWDICGALMHCYEDNVVFYQNFDKVKVWVKAKKDACSNEIDKEKFHSWVTFNDQAPHKLILECLTELNV